MASPKYFESPNNYIYIEHLGEEGEWLILPWYPDTIQDSMGSTFNQTTALSRTAPVFTYSKSGPRHLQVTLPLHRDLMDDVNTGGSNIKPELGEDYVDVLIRKLMSIAVPKYNTSDRSVIVPKVQLRFGNEVYIKGIVDGGVTVTYQKPILSNEKYAQVFVSFTVYETDPYDAESIAAQGSFRGMMRTMKNFNVGE